MILRIRERKQTKLTQTMPLDSSFRELKIVVRLQDNKFRLKSTLVGNKNQGGPGRRQTFASAQMPLKSQI
jgi:hypothetical protein